MWHFLPVILRNWDERTKHYVGPTYTGKCVPHDKLREMIAGQTGACYDSTERRASLLLAHQERRVASD